MCVLDCVQVVPGRSVVQKILVMIGATRFQKGSWLVLVILGAADCCLLILGLLFILLTLLLFLVLPLYVTFCICCDAVAAATMHFPIHRINKGLSYLN